MPRPMLTDDQRDLLGYINRTKLGPGQQIDTGSFGRLMLQPGYVNLVRKSVEDPQTWSRPGDSAAFYDRFRSPVANIGALTAEDVYPPQVSSSPEGSYDTLRYPALGDQPARTRIEFNPSVMQRIKDFGGDLKGFGRQMLQDIQSVPGQGEATAPAQPAQGFGARLLEGMAPANKVQSLYDYITSNRAPYDAMTTNGVPKKQTKLQKDGL